MRPPDLRLYLPQLAVHLGRQLRGDLLGVYATGSVVLGGYRHGHSDVDVAVVVRQSPDSARSEALGTGLGRGRLVCPARTLDLVVYSERSVGEPSGRTGDGRVVDRAILARHGVALVGPRPSALVADVPREHVLAALRDSVRANALDVAAAGDAVLDACRALRFAVEGRWSSKPDSGRWSRHQRLDGGVVADALEAAPLAHARVRPFLERVAGRLESCRA